MLSISMDHMYAAPLSAAPCGTGAAEDHRQDRDQPDALKFISDNNSHDSSESLLLGHKGSNAANSSHSGKSLLANNNSYGMTIQRIQESKNTSDNNKIQEASDADQEMEVSDDDQLVLSFNSEEVAATFAANSICDSQIDLNSIWADDGSGKETVTIKASNKNGLQRTETRQYLQTEGVDETVVTQEAINRDKQKCVRKVQESVDKLIQNEKLQNSLCDHDTERGELNKNESMTCDLTTNLKKSEELSNKNMEKGKELNNKDEAKGELSNTDMEEDEETNNKVNENNEELNNKVNENNEELNNKVNENCKKLNNKVNENSEELNNKVNENSEELNNKVNENSEELNNKDTEKSGLNNTDIEEAEEKNNKVKEKGEELNNKPGEKSEALYNKDAGKVENSNNKVAEKGEELNHKTLELGKEFSKDNKNTAINTSEVKTDEVLNNEIDMPQVRETTGIAKENSEFSLVHRKRKASHKRKMAEAELSTPCTSQAKQKFKATHVRKISCDTPKREFPNPECDSPEHLIPMKEHGWKRELVYRGVFDMLTPSGTVRKHTPADVYYYTPEKTKLRSKVMIQQYLNDNKSTPLTLQHFTFIRKPISELPWEIVRQAGTPRAKEKKKVSNKTSKSPLSEKTSPKSNQHQKSKAPSVCPAVADNTSINQKSQSLPSKKPESSSVHTTGANTKPISQTSQGLPRTPPSSLHTNATPVSEKKQSLQSKKKKTNPSSLNTHATPISQKRQNFQSKKKNPSSLSTHSTPISQKRENLQSKKKNPSSLSTHSTPISQKRQNLQLKKKNPSSLSTHSTPVSQKRRSLQSKKENSSSLHTHTTPELEHHHPKLPKSSLSHRTSYITDSQDEFPVEEDSDDEYLPYSHSVKIRKKAKNRFKGYGRGKKWSCDSSSDKEILVMSLPPPMVVIERDDDSGMPSEVNFSSETNSSHQHLPACNLLHPDEIKQEPDTGFKDGQDTRFKDGQNTGFRDGQDTGVKDSQDNKPVSENMDLEPVHFQEKPVRTKSTARKSTMPRIVLKNSSKPLLSSQEQPPQGQLCNNSCPGLEGQPPELQCCVCMCLFHHKCVNMEVTQNTSFFKCLRCKKLQMVPDPPRCLQSCTIQPQSTSNHIHSHATYSRNHSVYSHPQSSYDLPKSTSSHNLSTFTFHQSTSGYVPSTFSPLQSISGHPQSTFSHIQSISGHPQSTFNHIQSISGHPQSTFSHAQPTANHLQSIPSHTRPLFSPIITRMLSPIPSIPPPPLITRPQGPHLNPGVSVVVPNSLPVSSSSVLQPTCPPMYLPNGRHLMHPTVSSPLPLGSMPTPSIDAIRALRKILDKSSLPASTIQTSVNNFIPAPPLLLRSTALPPLIHSHAQRPSVLYPNLQIRLPPRLTAAPGVSSSSVGVVATTASTVCASMSSINSSSDVSSTGNDVRLSPSHAQLLTLPTAVMQRLNLSQPLALRINNSQIIVPPSCVINSQDGLKVLLPPSTFPLPSDPNTKLSVTVSNNTLTPTSGSPTVISTPYVLLGKNTLHQDTSDALSNTTKRNFSDNLIDYSTKNEWAQRCKRRKSQDRVKPSLCRIHVLFGGFDSMLHIFSFLSVHDLLQVSQVCRTWLKISRQKCLWYRVSLKNLQVTNWEIAATFLRDVSTQNLSLKGMSHQGDRNHSWQQFVSNLGLFSGLRNLEFGLVPSTVLHSCAEKLTLLKSFRAEHITDFSTEQMWTVPSKVDIGQFATLSLLCELRLRGVYGLVLPTFSFTGNLLELTHLKHLRILSLTSLCAMRDSEFQFLANLTHLEELELGDCLNWTPETFCLLGGLQKLQRLRLECGGDIPDIGLGSAISRLVRLERLELILFAIPASLEVALEQLPALHTLIFWPDTNNGMLPALVNTHALTAVVKAKHLRVLEWGIVIRELSDSSLNRGFDSYDSLQCTKTISLLRPGFSLDPNVKHDSRAIETVTVTEFTERLCASLPDCPTIKVFNTHVVGRLSPHSTL